MVGFVEALFAEFLNRTLSMFQSLYHVQLKWTKLQLHCSYCIGADFLGLLSVTCPFCAILQLQKDLYRPTEPDLELDKRFESRFSAIVYLFEFLVHFFIAVRN